ncbi:MAG: CoA transferase [Nitrospinota bacterium]|nr:MAG: CoA transferase [Nitrospinota bacterium]
MDLPLAGIQVLDFSNYISGPYCPMMLADMGAEVIKVESHQGDMLRYFPSTLPNESRMFLGLNRNKRSMVLDLKQPEGREVIYKLVKSTDVVVENFRPGVAERLEIDYDTLSRLNPRLVYCSISGYGQRGPLRNKPGFDQVLQSFGGVAMCQGREHGAPAIVQGSVIDYFTGMMAAYGVMTALFVRERTGIGQKIETSLLEATMAIQAGRLVWAEGEPREVQRDLHGGISGIYETRQGYIYVSAHTQKFWSGLCTVLGLEHLIDDPRYNSMAKRSAEAVPLRKMLGEAFLQKTADEWEQLLEAHGVPCSKVRPLEDLFDHPQVLANEMIVTLEHPVVGRFRMIGLPLKLQKTPGKIRRPAPTLGQHTEEILTSLGYTAEEIASLREKKVI